MPAPAPAPESCPLAPLPASAPCPLPPAPVLPPHTSFCSASSRHSSLWGGVWEPGSFQKISRPPVPQPQPGPSAPAQLLPARPSQQLPKIRNSEPQPPAVLRLPPHTSPNPLFQNSRIRPSPPEAATKKEPPQPNPKSAKLKSRGLATLRDKIWCDRAAALSTCCKYHTKTEQGFSNFV